MVRSHGPDARREQPPSVSPPRGHARAGRARHIAIGRRRQRLGRRTYPTGPPLNETAPTVSGTPAEGRKAKASKGVWSGAKLKNVAAAVAKESLQSTPILL
jgi:hypothetical protein